jgi:hypothetical protein
MTDIPIPLSLLDAASDQQPDAHCTEVCQRGWRVLSEVNAGLEADVERLTMALASRRRVVETARRVLQHLPAQYGAALRDALDACDDADRAGFSVR